MILPPGACPRCRQREQDIDRLQAELGERNWEIERLQGRVAELEDETFRLRQKVEQLERDAHRQAGPFRRRKQNKRRKRAGRRKGHKANLRPIPQPERIDRVIDVPCNECPDCHVPLYQQAQVVQYQTDLPPIVPIVTQFNLDTGYCPCCRRYCQGRHPEQTSDAIGAAGNTLGATILTMAAELKHRLGVPYRKICDFFATYCDLHIAPGTLVRAEQRFAELARPIYDLLIDALRRAGVVHADETGWRIHGINGWLWVFTNPQVTVYAIRTGKGARGHNVPEEILGPDFDGYLIVDGFLAYTALAYKKGQCNGHLLRRAKDLHDTVPNKEHQYLDRLITLIQDAIDLARRRDELTPEGYRRRAGHMEDRLILWLRGLPRKQSRALERLANHLTKHLDEWFVFLYHPEVPPTNNPAESMLRPAVITRKVGGCNKSLLGALVHSVLASIMVTCKQQGKKFLELAKQLWAATAPKAIALVPQPATPSG
jgi:transposase